VVCFGVYYDVVEGEREEGGGGGGGGGGGEREGQSKHMQTQWCDIVSHQGRKSSLVFIHFLTLGYPRL